MSNSFTSKLNIWVNSNSYEDWIKNTDDLAKASNSISFLGSETKKDCVQIFKNRISPQSNVSTLPCVKWSLISKDLGSLNPLLIKLKQLLLFYDHQVSDILSKMIDPASLIIDSVKEGDLVAIQEMASLGVDFNKVDVRGMTPLMWAATEGNHEVLTLLLQFGADPNIADEDGDTPLIQAAALGYRECVHALLERGKVEINQRNKDGWSALFPACQEQNEEIVKLLLDHQADINLQDYSGRTVLVIMTLFKHIESKKSIIKMLVEKLDAKSLLFHKEILRLIAVAHSTNGVGLSQIKSNGREYGSLALEGGTTQYWMRKMSKATNEFSKLYPEIFEENLSKQLTQMLDSGVFDSNEELLKRHGEGLPIILNTGFLGHAVSVLIWGDRFILCNRGEGSRKATEAFQFDMEALTIDILNRIKDVVDLKEEAYSNLFFKDLLHLLNLRPMEGGFEEKCILPLQIANNCTWASPELAVLAFLLLSDKNKLQFSEWAGFNQMYHLERYLGPRHLREKDKTPHERRIYRIDNQLLLSAMRSIVQTMPRRSAGLGNLNHILAKTLIFDPNDAAMNYLEAKKVIDALFKSNAEEVLGEFVDKVQKPEDDSSG